MRDRTETWLRVALTLTGLHSVALGVAMLIDPETLLRLMDWAPPGSRFFPAQSGLFLLILGAVYFAALRHRPLVWVLVWSKVAAVCFLVAETLAGECPRWMLLVAALDGTMGATVALLALRAHGIGRATPMPTHHGRATGTAGSPGGSTRPSHPSIPE